MIPIKIEPTNYDDKDLVIFAVMVLGIISLLILGVEAKEIIIGIVSGLFGIAVGKKI
jgi:hypothetical protein